MLLKTIAVEDWMLCSAIAMARCEDITAILAVRPLSAKNKF